MKTKHNPTPWKASRTAVYDTVKDANGGLVCFVSMSDQSKETMNRIVDAINNIDVNPDCQSSHISPEAIRAVNGFEEREAELKRLKDSHEAMLADLKTAYEALTTLDLFPYNHAMLVNMRASITKAEGK